jgi:hypothetical protein
MSLFTLLQFRHTTDQFQIQNEIIGLVLPHTKSVGNSLHQITCFSRSAYSYGFYAGNKKTLKHYILLDRIS